MPQEQFLLLHVAVFATDILHLKSNNENSPGLHNIPEHSNNYIQPESVKLDYF